MFRRRDHSPSGITHDARTQTLTGAGKQANTEQAVLALQVGSHLDPGLKRKYRPNEDTILVTQGIVPSASASTPPKSFALLIVADGVGGQAHGQEASRLAAQSLANYVPGSLSSQQMKPEAFLHLVMDTSAYIAQVGDSRLYLYRHPTGLVQITRDHSLVARLVEAGIIEAEGIYTHPMR